MNRKAVTVLTLALLIMAVPSSQAAHGRGKSHDGWGLEEMFFYKAGFILSEQDELGLTEEQMEAIKDLKFEIGKEMIKQQAEIDVLALEVVSKLRGYPIDVEQVNQIVDQEYELKKVKERMTVGALARLKSVLTEEQYQKLKKLLSKKV